MLGQRLDSVSDTHVIVVEVEKRAKCGETRTGTLNTTPFQHQHHHTCVEQPPRCESSSAAIVIYDLLTSPRIDPSIRVRRAIHANDILLVKRILASHPQLLHNPDTSDAGLSNSNLHLAASLGHLQICQFLIDLGHEMGGPALNENYETALILAARAGHIETVHYLCQTGPDGILCQDSQGRDAIMEASRGGHDTVVQILLTYVPGGAEEAVRRADKEGNTALHFASSNGHLLVLRTLLAAGADADQQNIWCWTPVAYSASVQAEVYLKGLINQTKAQTQQAQDQAAKGQAQASPRKGRLGTPELLKRGQLGAMAAGLRLVRDDDSDKPWPRA